MYSQHHYFKNTYMMVSAEMTEYSKSYVLATSIGSNVKITSFQVSRETAFKSAAVSDGFLAVFSMLKTYACPVHTNTCIQYTLAHLLQANWYVCDMFAICWDILKNYMGVLVFLVLKLCHTQPYRTADCIRA